MIEPVDLLAGNLVLEQRRPGVLAVGDLQPVLAVNKIPSSNRLATYQLSWSATFTPWSVVRIEPAPVWSTILRWRSAILLVSVTAVTLRLIASVTLIVVVCVVVRRKRGRESEDEQLGKKEGFIFRWPSMRQWPVRVLS